MSEKILLLHGLWMHPLAMHWLEQQFRLEGYQTFSPIYRSTSKSPVDNARAVHQAMQRHLLPAEHLHIVAHSLGGIVALQLLSLYADVPDGRLVTLGSPVKGSSVAQRAIKNWLLKPFIGHSFRYGLDGQATPPSIGREWGMLAGNKSLGLGLMLGAIPKPNDGVVALEETYHPAQSAHRLIPIAHTAMLYSTTVVKETLSFIRTGQFSSEH